jgi:tetratricopeptide (TPR) repeat protein
VARCSAIRVCDRIGFILLLWLFPSSPAPAQSVAPANAATVKADSLNVYADMRTSSAVVMSLKKGDAVLVDFEFKGAAEKWCSVKLPSETARLGYVQCQGLERQERRFGQASASDAGRSSANGVAAARAANPKHAVNNLPITPPPARAARGYDEMVSLVVREDAIDVVKIAQFENDARGGSAAAMARAALAHLAAGNFELSRNSSDEAIEHYTAALPFAAKHSDLLLANLLSLAYVQLRRSEYSTALEYLDRARSVAPQSLAVAQLSGWAYYGLDRTEEAIATWKAAQRIQPTAELAALIEKAQQDKDTESEFRRGDTSHFILHYQGNASPALAADVLRTLEEQFRDIQAAMRFSPAEPIAVVLYTQETFRDITRAPGWAGAANDGRIRVPVQGLSAVSDQLARVLKHELTHSFIRQKTQGRCPTWLNEGLAQWMDGSRSDSAAQPLIAAYETQAYIPLRQLEGPWTGFSGQGARYAYAWSLASVETIIANSGYWGIERLLGDFGQESSVEAALGLALQTNYADLDRATAEYLRRTYIR